MDHMSARVQVPRSWADVNAPSAAAIGASSSAAVDYSKYTSAAALALGDGDALNATGDSAFSVEERLQQLLLAEDGSGGSSHRRRRSPSPNSVAVAGDSDGPRPTTSGRRSPPSPLPTTKEYMLAPYGTPVRGTDAKKGESAAKVGVLSPLQLQQRPNTSMAAIGGGGAPTANNGASPLSLPKMRGRSSTPIAKGGHSSSTPSQQQPPRHLLAPVSAALIASATATATANSNNSSALSLTTKTDGSPHSSFLNSRARTPMADLLQRRHDDLLVEWGQRQQTFAHELYTDRRVAKAIDKRRADRIAKARACQTPLQLRRAAEREERLRREVAARDEERRQQRGRRSEGSERRLSVIVGSGSNDAANGNGGGFAGTTASNSFGRRTAQLQQPQTTQEIIAAMEAEAEVAFRSRRGPGAGGSRYHPNRYVPLLASSSDEEALSMCSNSSCSECEITRRRRGQQQQQQQLGSGSVMASRKYRKRAGDGSGSTMEASARFLGVGKASGGGASPRSPRTPRVEGSKSVGGGSAVSSPRGDQHSSKNSPDNSLQANAKTPNRCGERTTRTAPLTAAEREQQQQAAILQAAMLLSSAPNGASSDGAAPSPSAVFLEIQKQRERDRIAERLATVERKEVLTAEAAARRAEAFDARRSRTALTTAKAEEVNARLDRKIFFGKLLMSNKAAQQEHKDSQKRAIAEERAKHVSAEAKAKGALLSKSREVFTDAKVQVHKSLYLQEKLNIDYRARNNRSEYHHHAQQQQQQLIGGGGQQQQHARSRQPSPAPHNSSHGSQQPPPLGGFSPSPAAAGALAATSSPHRQQQQPPSAEATAAAVEAMFNQAIDARKAVSRRALGRHLSSQRALVQRWQQLEHEAHDNHQTLGALQQGLGK